MSSFCDDRCTTAKGSSCDCECGGQNHGGLVVGKDGKDGGGLHAIDRSDREDPADMESKEIKRELDALHAQELRLDEFDSPSKASEEEDSIEDRKTLLLGELDKRSGKDKVRAARAAMEPLPNPGAHSRVNEMRNNEPDSHTLAMMATVRMDPTSEYRANKKNLHFFKEEIEKTRERLAKHKELVKAYHRDVEKVLDAAEKYQPED